MTSSDRVVILHLTDLHFGSDRNEGDLSARKLALAGLLNEVRNLDGDWKPNIVCISGDIAYKGEAAEYRLAAQWVSELVRALNVPAEALFFCPGNHDVIRSRAAGFARPSDPKEADEVLNVPIRDHYKEIFRGYSEFCKGLGVPPYSLGNDRGYLVGERNIYGTRFVALNSAWCSKDDQDKGKLWIGLPQIKYLETNNQLAREDGLLMSDPTVILIHHPKEWLNPDEYQALDMRPNTLDYLARRCHLILSGHTHGEPRYADQIAEAGWHLTGGATYAEAGYYNSFRIIQVQPDQLTYRSHEYDPRLTDHRWRTKGGCGTLPIGHKGEQTPKSRGSASEILITKYREKALLDAKKLIEGKSRILKSRGQLPETIPLNIAAHSHGLRQRFDEEGRLLTESQMQVLLPRTKPSGSLEGRYYWATSGQEKAR